MPEKNRGNGVAGTPGGRHLRFEAGGGPVSVYEAGNPGQPAVVLLHGAMYDEARFAWDQLFPVLAGRYHVHAVDLPRHGSSRPWTGRMTHSRLMRILAATCEQLGLNAFHMGGLSMGGGLAIDYAARHPHQVQSLILFEPGGLGTRLDHHFLSWLYLHTPGTRRLISRLNRGKSNAALVKTLSSLFTKGTAPSDPERLVDILRDEINAKASYAEADLDDWQIDAIAPFRLSWNLLGVIPALRCPSLWLRGAESRLVKQDEMERAVSLLGSRAELRVIPNAGHLLPLEQPEAANRAVLTFLDGLSTHESEGVRPPAQH